MQTYLVTVRKTTSSAATGGPINSATSDAIDNSNSSFVDKSTGKGNGPRGRRNSSTADDNVEEARTPDSQPFFNCREEAHAPCLLLNLDATDDV